MVISGYVLWGKAVHNEPAAAVADKAHWTNLQHVSSITGLTLNNYYEKSKKKKRYGIVGQPFKAYLVFVPGNSSDLFFVCYSVTVA